MRFTKLLSFASKSGENKIPFCLIFHALRKDRLESSKLKKKNFSTQYNYC